MVVVVVVAVPEAVEEIMKKFLKHLSTISRLSRNTLKTIIQKEMPGTILLKSTLTSTNPSATGLARWMTKACSNALSTVWSKKIS